MKVSLQESTKKINDRMKEESKMYQNKLKILQEITGDQFEDDVNPNIVGESQTAFDIILAKVGPLLATANTKKNSLDPKIPYTFNIEPVNTAFFEITCGGKPSPIIMRVVNDTEGGGIELSKG